MKLKTKITWICISFFAAFSVLIGSIILVQFQKTILKNTLQKEEKIFFSELKNTDRLLQQSSKEVYSVNVCRNILIQSMRSSISGEYAIYEGNTELFNASAFQFSFHDIMEYTSEMKADWYTEPGINMLLLYSTIKYRQSAYTIIKVIDVTAEYTNCRTLILEALLMLFTALLLGGIALFHIIKHCLSPFEGLKETASRIADGDYDKRVIIKAQDEIGEIGISFNCMANAIEDKIESLTKLNQAQAVMMGSIAHELRTPLTAMIGYSSTLQKIKLPKSQQEKALQYIEHESRRLSSLSEKIMQLTGVMSCTTAPSLSMPDAPPILCHDIICETLQIIETADDTDLSELIMVQIDPTMTIPGDRQLLISMCRNLIENALKVCSREISYIKPIEITDERLSSAATFCIKDHGIGIAPEELPHIMEPFYMVDKSRSHKQGGAGLGLALCKAIADNSGLDFHIESTPGEGTCAILRWTDSSVGHNPITTYGILA